MHAAAAQLVSAHEPEILVDYRSDAGPAVTQVRGGLVVSTLDYLKSAGFYDQYVAALTPSYHEQLLFAISASWLPIETMMAHMAALDALSASRAMMIEGGQSVGQSFGKMVYGALVKASRSVGGDPAWLILKQSARYYQRVYVGGGLTLIRTGPKDALLEMHGLPFATSACFRAAHQSYMSALFRMTTHAAYVKPAMPRERHPHCIATSFSWV